MTTLGKHIAEEEDKMVYQISWSLSGGCHSYSTGVWHENSMVISYLWRDGRCCWSFGGAAFIHKVGEHLLKLRKDIARNQESQTSSVSRGPPALSGWNCTPQTFLPDSEVDLIPSTEESLQLIKKGSQPSGKGSCNLRAYWWFWLKEDHD